MSEDPIADPAGVARLRRDIVAAEEWQKQVGVINPRPPGARNRLIQMVKKAMARMLRWYARPIVEYHIRVTQALMDVSRSLTSVQDRLTNLERSARAQQSPHLTLTAQPRTSEWPQNPVQEGCSPNGLNVVTEISPQDGMFVGDMDHYMGVGFSALRCIQLALMTAGNQTRKMILDLPCGYGRVLRTLKAAFPDAQFTACDLLKDGVDFCARVLGATPAYSDENPDNIDLRGPFDLIWCGSLLTHLDQDRWAGFLRLFERLLYPNGVVVFTVHGRRAVQHLSERTIDYGLRPRDVKGVLDEYRRSGFGYSDYGDSAGYGISMSSPSWVISQVEQVSDLKLLTYIEAGWDNHQDVLACLRPR